MLRRTFASRGVPDVPDPAYDIIVSGGGLVGSAMMASLQRLKQRLGASRSPDRNASDATSAASPLSRLLMVDAGPRPDYNPTNVLHQLRTVSITPVASKVLDNLKCWERLTTKHPYYRMAVRHEQTNSPSASSANRSSSFFMSSLLGATTSAAPLLEFTDLRKPIGYICYNTELNTAMVEVVEDQSASDSGHDVLRFKSKLERVALPDNKIISGPLGTASLRGSSSTSDSLRFRLLLGCEGRQSPLRDVLAAPSTQIDYAQTAFVCSVQLEKVDDGNVCSFQNFFRDGSIIAMLPTSAESANIIFSTTTAHAQQLKAASQAELVEALNARLCSFAPRDIPRIVSIVEGTVDEVVRRACGSFPLKLNFVTTPYAERAILVGDAAHGIHPFAGQGLNLGIYDVCALTSVLESALKSGQDVGSSVAVGQAFASEMMAHTGPMIGVMEAIKRLTYSAPGLACLGMKALNCTPLISTVAKDVILQVGSGADFAYRHTGSFLLE